MWYKLDNQEIKLVLRWLSDKDHNYNERGFDLEKQDVDLAKRLNNMLSDNDKLGWVEEL